MNTKIISRLEEVAAGMFKTYMSEILNKSYDVPNHGLARLNFIITPEETASKFPSLRVSMMPIRRHGSFPEHAHRTFRIGYLLYQGDDERVDIIGVSDIGIEHPFQKAIDCIERYLLFSEGFQKKTIGRHLVSGGTVTYQKLFK